MQDLIILKKKVEVSHNMDYGNYQFSKREWVIYSGAYLGLVGIVSLLFYRSLIAFFILLPGSILFFKERKMACRKKRIKCLEEQFLAGMQAVSNALSAGYSIENAFKEAETELAKVYDKEDFIVMEFQMITRLLALNRPIESLLSDFGKRSHAEDIESFAEVFVAARRSGGDLIAIIRNTVSAIGQKAETRAEIEVCIAAKKMEQNVMSVVPMGILIYMGISSPGFLDGMYHNLAGIAIMTGCLGVYLGAWYWGRKLVDIRI